MDLINNSLIEKDFLAESAPKDGTELPISTARVRNPAGFETLSFEAIEAPISFEFWINSIKIKFKNRGN